MKATGIYTRYLSVDLAAASLLFIDFTDANGLQSSDLPEIVITEFPPAKIDVSRSDFSISGYVSDPFTLEVQVQGSNEMPVSDDHFGPNTYLLASLALTNRRGEVITNAVEPMATVNGIARFESITLFVAPDIYALEVTVDIIFAVAGLGETSLTLGSGSVSSLNVGVEPTATPSPTATTNPYAGTPAAVLTLQYFATANAPAVQTLQAQVEGVSTALATTPQPTQFCPPNDPFNCNFPTSTPMPTSTATPAPSATAAPLTSPEDGIVTVNVSSLGTSYQNEVSGPRGDTSDTIDLQFSLAEITEATNFTVSLACPENTNAAVAILATGSSIACGRSSSITASPLELTFRVIVTSLATRAQTRTPYILSIVPSR